METPRDKDPGVGGPQREPTPLQHEAATGALVGAVACAVMAGVVEAALSAAIFAIVAGVCAGAVIGLVIWVGDNAAAPGDDRIVPPAREHRRDREP